MRTKVSRRPASAASVSISPVHTCTSSRPVSSSRSRANGWRPANQAGEPSCASPRSAPGSRLHSSSTSAHVGMPVTYPVWWKVTDSPARIAA